MSTATAPTFPTTPATPLAPVPTETFKPKVTAITEEAGAVSIETAPQYEQAAELLKGIKALRDEVKQTYDPRIKQAHELHRGLIADMKKFDTPLANAERDLKLKMGDFVKAEERRQALLAAEVQAEAQKQHEEAAMAEAEALEKAGDHEGATRVLEEAESNFVAPAPTPAAPHVSGVASRTKWVPEVTNKMALVKAVAKGKAPLAMLDVNMTALRKQAESLGPALNYPGVVVKKDVVIAAGKR